jgi:hypothetical protein
MGLFVWINRKLFYHILNLFPEFNLLNLISFHFLMRMKQIKDIVKHMSSFQIQD